ncbi:unnamed protein product [Acanthoscelides obtectus]|uniref:Protein yellow n=1 Tax=Acanthoscelides obtectus TaxID=200917 RepID=A0A9P0LMH1_ACAOB|nr:unnamed protein product [Acanthoscelides obtectus]CAK1669145.1 Protein yellow [Acanthoscelides obtectus]
MRQTTFALAATVTAALICGASCLVQPQEVFSWKEMEFAWPSKEAMDEAVKSGEYIRENNLPLGIDRWKDKLFVTVPRNYRDPPGSTCRHLPASRRNRVFVRKC